MDLRPVAPPMRARARGTMRPWADPADCWGCGLAPDQLVAPWGGRGAPVPSCTWCAELRELRAELPMPDPGRRSDGKLCKRPGCQLARKHHGRCWGADGWLVHGDDLGPR